MKGWEYDAEWGRFRIVGTGTWSIQLEGRELRGGFPTPENALKALLEGDIPWTSDIILLSSIYFPSKLTGWRSIDC